MPRRANNIQRSRFSSARRNRTNRRGAFTVEFAICCGIFFVVIMSGFEFTRFMYARHSVDQAAYEAARVGIVPGRTPTDVRNKANSILNATGVKSATVTVTPAQFDSSTREVTVEIRCRYADNSWMKPVFLKNKDLVSTITLDHENKAYLIVQGNIGNNNNEPIDQ